MNNKFRVRELKMASGEVRFIPERMNLHPLKAAYGGYEEVWILIGTEDHYLTFEQAIQQVGQYKLDQPQEIRTEVIHPVE